MLRRLAIIASALALSACSEEAFAPTGALLSGDIGDGRTVPQGLCNDSTASPDYRLFPICTDGTPWPDDMFDVRLRHDYENVTVRSPGGGARGKVRLF